MNISALRKPTEQDIADLAALLVDAVDAGAAVSFLAPLATSDACAWWQKVFTTLDARAAVLVARSDDGHIVGSVQVQPAWAPNQPHRGDICKLVVHRNAQRRGVARSLMQAAEIWAQQASMTLLTLDAKRGAVAEQLYASTGWIRVGVIPEYALDTDGQSWHDTVIYYKRV